ncbi:hypothetical protein L1887_22540 [Cichorium endivia]|nr:hypothetical protein L1887_22540 [Cichorium endivia]
MLELIAVTSSCALVVAPYEEKECDHVDETCCREQLRFEYPLLPLPSCLCNALGLGLGLRRKPQLVLLDHGLYTELDVATRTNYAALWKGLVLADAREIKENCMKLGAGEDLGALFAGIPTMSPWNRVIDPTVDHLAIQRNASGQSELQIYASLYFPQPRAFA